MQATTLTPATAAAAGQAPDPKHLEELLRHSGAAAGMTALVDSGADIAAALADVGVQVTRKLFGKLTFQKGFDLVVLDQTGEDGTDPGKRLNDVAEALGVVNESGMVVVLLPTASANGDDVASVVFRDCVADSGGWMEEAWPGTCLAVLFSSPDDLAIQLACLS